MNLSKRTLDRCEYNKTVKKCEMRKRAIHGWNVRMKKLEKRNQIEYNKNR